MRAERQYNCTLLYRDERQRNPPKGGPPQDPEGGGLAPRPPIRALYRLDALPSFRQLQLCYACARIHEN